VWDGLCLDWCWCVYSHFVESSDEIGWDFDFAEPVDVIFVVVLILISLRLYFGIGIRVGILFLVVGIIGVVCFGICFSSL